MKKINKTSWHSLRVGNLCKGCSMCVKGKKLVLFVTGVCPRRCFYCPISAEKYGSDDVYANEWIVSDERSPVELLEEVRLTNAEGAGITGGDPLARLDKTCTYIRLLKKEFGSGFHIHLYTSLNLVNVDSLKALYDSGLDEIRFHPDLEKKFFWNRISLAKNFDWAVGIEIPVVPSLDKFSLELLDFVKDKVDFVNLNELEFSDTDLKHYSLNEYGFNRKDSVSYAVKGSKELGLRLLRRASKNGLSAHFCTAKLKDSVQVGKRLKLRAKNVAKPFDRITNEGLLLRGAVYAKGFEPGFKDAKKNKFDDSELLSLVVDLNKKGFSDKDLFLDATNKRLLMSCSKVKRHSAFFKEKGFKPCIVEEYPTHDFFCVELSFL